MFGVTILGNNSALPAHGRHPTAQAVTLGNEILLIDCGEGTQMQLADYKVKKNRINHIFISHLHGDHYFGLIGLLTSMALLGRTQPLHVYAHSDLKAILDLQLKVSGSFSPYAFHFHVLGEDGILLDEEKFTVESFRVYHRIECWGFIIREKNKPRHINPVAVKAYDVPREYFAALQQGHDFISPDGVMVDNTLLTYAADPSLSYAYSGDTLFNEVVAEKVKGVHTLYHEATYLKDGHARANLHYHSTTEQAATIAKMAGVNRLLVGHFSSKYEDLGSFEQEARDVFPNTSLALEGSTYIIQ
jgi:ribonuclease Z